MPSARQQVEDRGGWSGGALLKGSMFPKGTKSVSVVIASVEASPANWSSALVVKFKEETFGATAMGLNSTNIGKLSEAIGDDYDTWAGWEVVIKLTQTNNPSMKTKEFPQGVPVVGLEIVGAKPARGAKK